MPKVDILEWTEFLIRLLKVILGSKIMFALVVLKINNITTFKDNNKVRENNSKSKNGQ